jgi:predicted secreted protein
MTVNSALVLFAIIWFLALLVALPIGLTTQGEAGEVVPGTPSSAPVDAMIRRKVLWVTLATIAIWAAVCAFILWGGVTVRDIDFFHRM